LLLRTLPPFQLAGLLYLGAALGAAPVVWLERRRGLRPRATPPDAARLAGAVLLGGLAGPVLLLFALRRGPAGSASLWLTLEMVATAVLGALFFGEHLGRAGRVGVAGVVAAGALLAGTAGWPGAAALALVAMACVCWALDNHWTALVDGVTPATSALVKGGGAGVLGLAIGALAEPAAASRTTVAAALATGPLGYRASRPPLLAPG